MITLRHMRIHHFRPAELDDAQRALYDTLTTGTRKAVHDSLPAEVRMTDAEGRLQGPFNAMLVHPHLGVALQEVSRRLRFEGTLPARTREIIILVVAGAEQSDFEWAAHAPIAASVGVGAPEIEALGAGVVPDFADPVDHAAARLALSLVNSGDVDDVTWAAVHEVLGDTGVYEVSTTVGIYRLIAQQLRLFRVTAPAGPWSTGA